MSNAMPEAVKKRFTEYPRDMRERLKVLRDLIRASAKTLGSLSALEETLKWGEPSYIFPGGTTIRIDWKEKTPEHYYMFFHCQTRLVDTFKERFGDAFHYQGNRALAFHRDDPLPTDCLQTCIAAALEYHSRKHLPLLGL